MAAEILSVGGGVINVGVTGRLSEADLVAVQRAAAEVIRERGNVRVLVMVDDFEGWEQGATWDDTAVQDQNDPFIKGMAIVGDRRWQDLTLLFTAQGLRPFPIEYFGPDELDRAMSWLEER